MCACVCVKEEVQARIGFPDWLRGGRLGSEQGHILGERLRLFAQAERRPPSLRALARVHQARSAQGVTPVAAAAAASRPCAGFMAGMAFWARNWFMGGYCAIMGAIFLVLAWGDEFL